MRRSLFRGMERTADKGSREALFVRQMSRGGAAQTYASHGAHVTYETFRPFISTRPPEIAANIVVCLIHQANYLLDQQIRRLEKDFVEQGGLRERMTRARLEERARQGRP